MNTKVRSAYWGLLREICKELGVNKNIKHYVNLLHEAVKIDFGISDFSELSDEEVERIIHELRAYFAIEHSLEVGYKDKSIKEKTLGEIFKQS